MSEEIEIFKLILGVDNPWVLVFAILAYRLPDLLLVPIMIVIIHGLWRALKKNDVL